MIRRLQTEFVPCGARRLDLERQQGNWWGSLVSALKPQWRPGYTSQGSYVVGADGTGYAADNYNRDAGRLLMLLDRGLAAFRQRPPARMTITDEQVRKAEPPHPDAGVSVVQVFTRVRERSRSGMPSFLGREQMWIYPDEAREILAQPSGRSFSLPRTLAARMVVFHVIDNTRGQPLPWRPEDVRRASFTAQETATSGGRRSFRFTGDFLKQASRAPFSDRGHEGRLEGELTIEPQSRKVTRFRAFSDSRAWATGGPAGPGQAPPGRYSLLIGMREASSGMAASCPPEGAETGPYYSRTPLFTQ